MTCRLFLLQRPRPDVRVPFGAGLAAMQSAMAIASRIASGVEAASAHVPGNGAAAHGVSYPFTPKHLAATLALLEASQAFTLNFVWATHSIGTKVYVNAGRAGARYLRPTGTHLCATAMVHTGRTRKHTDACCTGGRGARARWRCKKKKSASTLQLHQQEHNSVRVVGHVRRHRARTPTWPVRVRRHRRERARTISSGQSRGGERNLVRGEAHGHTHPYGRSGLAVRCHGMSHPA